MKHYELLKHRVAELVADTRVCILFETDFGEYSAFQLVYGLELSNGQTKEYFRYTWNGRDQLLVLAFYGKDGAMKYVSTALTAEDLENQEALSQQLIDFEKMIGELGSTPLERGH